MQSYLLYFHSILRYFILLFAIAVTIQSLVGLLGKKEFKKSNRVMALFLLITCDIQLLLGLGLYYTHGWINILMAGKGMSDVGTRFWTVEHSLGMVIAIVLVHVGYAVAKKNIDHDSKYKRLFWCVFIALGIFFSMIPWQYKQVVGRPNVPHLNSGS